MSSQSHAVSETSFSSSTVHIVQQDCACASTKECLSPCHGLVDRESQLPAHHSGIINAPEVITDGAPAIVVADLHTALAGGHATYQSQVTIGTALASHSSVLCMHTVVDGEVATGEQPILSSCALHIVYVDGSSSLAKEGEEEGSSS